MLGFCRHILTQWSLDALNFHYITNSNFSYLDVVNLHLFLLCLVGGFSTFLYWLMYMPTIWNFLCERKKSLQINIKMHKSEGFKFYLAPHNWFTHLQASTDWTYILYQQIHVQGPHVLLQLLHHLTSFQVTSCTWEISSITLDPLGFAPHIGSAQADPKHPAAKSYCKACVERKICTENVLGFQLHPNQKETQLLNWAYLSWANFKQDKWIRWGESSNIWFRV
jgi:hypothetical protein